MTNEERAEFVTEFVRLFMQLDPDDQELVYQFIDALAADDVETAARIEREFASGHALLS